ncbi:MAG: hypothetical protein WKF66_07580 [Pedobacter sp.]
MEPFNIRINYNAQELTLTILPNTDMQFTIVYFGGVLGVVQYLGHSWVLMDRNSIPESGLPEYKMGYKNSRTEIELTTEVVNYLGIKINSFLSTNSSEPVKTVPAHRRKIRD